MITCSGEGRRDCACPRARHQHGSLRAYNVDGCRGFACRVAHARAASTYRSGGTWREAERVPSCGTRRRLQALAVIGHSAAALAPLLGMTPAYVTKLRTETRHPMLEARTAAKVTAVYDQLWDAPNISANGRRCSTQARRSGWVPPMWWDDDRIEEPGAVPESGLLRHGTHAAFNRHKSRGETPCQPCRVGERDYQADRNRRRRAAARQAVAA